MTFKINKFDYEYLTGQWEGAYGAAYNVVAEDCYEAGYCYRDGHPTAQGRMAIEEYERENSS